MAMDSLKTLHVEDIIDIFYSFCVFVCVCVFREGKLRSPAGYVTRTVVNLVMESGLLPPNPVIYPCTEMNAAALRTQRPTDPQTQRPTNPQPTEPTETSSCLGSHDSLIQLLHCQFPVHAAGASINLPTSGGRRERASKCPVVPPSRRNRRCVKARRNAGQCYVSADPTATCRNVSLSHVWERHGRNENSVPGLYFFLFSSPLSVLACRGCIPHGRERQLHVGRLGSPARDAEHAR